MSALPKLGPIIEPAVTRLRVGIWLLTAAICTWVLSSYSTYWSIGFGVAFIPALSVLAALRPDQFRLESRLRIADPNRIQLAGPMWFVSLVLALRAFARYDILLGPHLFYYSIAATLCIGLLVWACISKASLWHSLGIATILGTALVVHINGISTSSAQLLDSGPIAKKYITGRGAARMLVIQGTIQQTHLRVDDATYEAIVVGARACLFARSGLLDVRFRRLGQCQDS